MSTVLKKQIISDIKQSLKSIGIASDKIPPITLEVPQDKQHGEFACNVAMRLAGVLKKNPLEIGESIGKELEKRFVVGALQTKIKKVEVKKPGFINFFLSDLALQEVILNVLREEESFGRSNFGAGKKIQIEFVSANPTGPLSVAHARQAAVGDALASILNFIGYSVKKEFYVNDEGNQINILGRSIRDRAREMLGEKFEFPEDNYQGDYIKDMAKEFMARHNLNSVDEIKSMDSNLWAQYGSNDLLDVIKQELKDFGVHFNIWSYQSKIATIPRIEEVIDELRKRNFIYDHEGAVWFRSSSLGDDKDRVIKKGDGNYTYLAPDIVYHKDKFTRGFDRVINIWGPDHHGYIPRITAAVEALGYDPKALTILIVQLATIFRDGKPLSMSTRRGQYISLRKVMEEVGTDAARFFFLMRHIKVHLEFDLELAKKETPENPVYYVQYAHARINSILNLAGESSLRPARDNLHLLKEEEELDLMREISYFPDILLICGYQLDCFALVAYLQSLATSFHRFYDQHRVLGENTMLTGQRLALIDAAKIVLASGLKLLGVSAPVKM